MTTETCPKFTKPFTKYHLLFELVIKVIKKTMTKMAQSIHSNGEWSLDRISLDRKFVII